MPTIPLRLVAIDDRHHQWDQQYEPCRDGRASDAPVLQRAFEAYPHDRPRCFKYPERDRIACNRGRELWPSVRSEEHTSELQSLMRNSYAVFCLKKKNTHKIRYIVTNI